MKLEKSYNILTQENQGAASIDERSETSCHNDDIYYAITIKPMLKDHHYCSTDFKDIFLKRLKRFRFLKLAWELDSKEVLHCHILAEGPADIKYKLIHQYGWHIDISVLKTSRDRDLWANYMRKGDSLEALFKADYSKPLNLFD